MPRTLTSTTNRAVNSSTLVTNYTVRSEQPLSLLLETQPKAERLKSSECIPKSNVVFLKTHKCASSTVQNVLLRYGVAHNKVFVLPPINNYLGHPVRFNRNLVPEPDGFEYNILAHHSRLNYTEMRALMPPDTVFVTIIRDPVDLFESMFSYYKLENFYKMNLSELNTSIVAPTRNSMLEKLSKRYNNKIGLNQMLFDLGLDEEDFLNYSNVINYIHVLDNMFDLVMVAERMEESLILLKKLLCWNYDDLVVFKVSLVCNSSFEQNAQRTCLRLLYSCLALLMIIYSGYMYTHFVPFRLMQELRKQT